MEEMYFYHSFPSNTEEKKQIERGLEIIESMAKIGFLLSPGPKPVEWGKYFSLGDRMKIKQKRICFTFIRTTELKKPYKSIWKVFY